MRSMKDKVIVLVGWEVKQIVRGKDNNNDEDEVILRGGKLIRAMSQLRACKTYNSRWAT